MGQGPQLTYFDLVWAAWFVLFVALELAAVFGAPWQTLSGTAWGIEHLSDVAKIVTLAGLTVLTVHIVFRWP